MDEENKLTINLGNGFGLQVPNNFAGIVTIKVDVHYTLYDDYSAVDCHLQYPSPFKKGERP